MTVLRVRGEILGEPVELTGSFRQRSERIGRAVPPFMMRALATRIRAVLDRDLAAVAA